MTPTRPRAGLRSWFARSLGNKIGALAAVLIICQGLFLAALAYSHVRTLLVRNAEDRLNAYAELLANRASLILASVERNVASLASNSLIANGLVDSGGRQAYLNPFLRDHRLPVSGAASLTLVDHRGGIVASNTLRQGSNAYKGAAWLEPIRQAGVSAAEVTSSTRSLLLAYPVVLPATGTPEGALVVELALDAVFESATEALNGNVVASLWHRGERVIARQGDTAYSDLIVVRKVLGGTNAGGKSDLAVEVGLPRAAALDGLDSLTRNIAAACVISTMLAIWLARGAARLVLRPLGQLSRLIERIRNERKFDQTVPVASSDEIGRLANSFNHMFESLREATETLEAQVVSRTAALDQTRAWLDAVQAQMNDGLIVVDGRGCIEAFNAAAERLFDQAATQVIGRGIARLIPGWQATIVDASVEISGEGRFQRQVSALVQGTERAVELSVSLIVFDKLPRWVVVVRDVTERRRAESAMLEANRQLSESVAQLRARDEDMAQIHRLNELLASCHSSSEAHPMIERVLGRLFRGHDGALAVERSSAGLLEVVSHWGPRDMSHTSFPLDACWALRLGRVHDSRANPDAQCSHYSEAPGGVVCAPLAVQGETFGLLMASFDSSAGSTETHRLNQLFTMVSEAVKFGLSNLKLREALHHAALRDQLTGLFNRRYFDETMPRELSRMRRTKSELSLAVIDIDHFKRFNDSFGHEAGDLVLREVSQVFLNSLRASDIVCRIGGEEFVAVLLDANASNAAMRMESVCANIKRLTLHYRGQSLPQVTASVGIAQAPIHGDATEVLIRAADTALYQAKTQGRDRIVIA